MKTIRAAFAALVLFATLTVPSLGGDMGMPPAPVPTPEPIQTQTPAEPQAQAAASETDTTASVLDALLDSLALVIALT